MKWVVLTDMAGKTHVVNLERVIEVLRSTKETRVLLATGADFSLAEGEWDKLKNTLLGKDA